MKKEVRKALAISGLAIALGASGLTLDANAASMMNGGNGHRIGRQAHTLSVSNNTSRIIQRHRRITPGVVTAISDSSLTITHGIKTFTVNTTSTTRFLNLKWATINLTDIKVGDRIRIAGTTTNTTISANTVRDISLQ